MASVRASNKSAANFAGKEPARGRKPVLRDELAAVVAKQQVPRERISFLE
ncbi:MAG: hypothetical protein JXA30_02725 [Deltaproteobacteria bacterium]|nr:hypothetical protein [Deltaproteobacteria bacterium]